MIQTKRINNIDIDYVIANPSIDDIGVQFGIGATVKELGQKAAATVAANFNFADNATGKPIGRVIVDGKTLISDISKTAPRDELFAMPDGKLYIGKAPLGAVWALQGSPRLLHNKVNVIADTVKRDQTGTDIWQRNAYRLAVGLTADNNLVIVRTKQVVSLDALANIMLGLGCVDALNGDGGGSAYLWPADNGWGRKMGVALTITKGVGDDMQIKQDFIPIGRKNRPRHAMTPEYITMHDTSNTATTADAANHAKYLKGDAAANAPVSWHFTVDDKQIIQHLPIDESGYHAGDGAGDGNRKSIGIEMCENAGVDRKKVEANAAWLVAHLLKQTKLPIDAVVQHNKWSGKNCPNSLRSKPNGWTNFIAQVQKELNGGEGVASDVSKDHWASNSIAKAIGSGIIKGYADGTFKPNNNVTRAELAVILDRAGLLESK